MGLSYVIDEDMRLVRMTTDARPSHDEWFAALGEICADSRYRPGFDLLLDRRLSATAPSAHAVRVWMREHSRVIREHGNGRLAVVAGDPVVFGMMRMAAVFAEEQGSVLGVFWTEAEALAWLGHSSKRSG